MKLIELRRRNGPMLHALVDDDDYERLSRLAWYAHRVRGSKTVYAKTIVGGRTVYMHRMVLGEKEGLTADHIDGDGLHNQKANLRYLTSADNMLTWGGPDLIEGYTSGLDLNCPEPTPRHSPFYKRGFARAREDRKRARRLSYAELDAAAAAGSFREFAW